MCLQTLVIQIQFLQRLVFQFNFWNCFPLILRDFYYSCYKKCQLKWTAIDENQWLNNLDLLFLERYPSTVSNRCRWFRHDLRSLSWLSVRVQWIDIFWVTCRMNRFDPLGFTLFNLNFDPVITFWFISKNFLKGFFKLDQNDYFIMR